MFPVAISVGTHDRLLKLPYTWYGPEMPYLRFRGRPLQEWAALAVALPVLWPLLDIAITIGAVTRWPAFNGVGWAICHIGGTWMASSGLAGLFYRRLINTDRDAAWILQTAWSETKRVAHAYGPLDPTALYATAPLWALATWAFTTTNLPFPLDLALAAAGTWPIGCLTAAALHTPAQAEQLATQRALRRGPTATLALTGSTDADAA